MIHQHSSSRVRTILATLAVLPLGLVAACSSSAVDGPGAENVGAVASGVNYTSRSANGPMNGRPNNVYTPVLTPGGKCLSVNTSTKDIYSATCTGAANQQWMTEAVNSSGRLAFKLHSQSFPSECLAVTGGSIAPNVRVSSGSCSATARANSSGWQESTATWALMSGVGGIFIPGGFGDQGSAPGGGTGLNVDGTHAWINALQNATAWPISKQTVADGCPTGNLPFLNNPYESGLVALGCHNKTLAFANDGVGGYFYTAKCPNAGGAQSNAFWNYLANHAYYEAPYYQMQVPNTCGGGNTDGIVTWDPIDGTGSLTDNNGGVNLAYNNVAVSVARWTDGRIISGSQADNAPCRMESAAGTTGFKPNWAGHMRVSGGYCYDWW